MPKPRLADFKGGIVPVVRWPTIREDQTAINQIQKWIDEKKLVCYGQPNPHPFADLLETAEEPVATSAPPASAMVDRQKTLVPVAQKESEPNQKPKKRAPELKGFAWIAIEQEFNDGLILPVGCRITPFDKDQPHKFESGDIHAALDCASRLTRETENKPMISSIAGSLRVLNREFLTGDRPSEEAKPRTKEKS